MFTCLALLFLAAQPAADTLAFAVAPKTKLVKCFDSSWVEHSKDLRVKVNGKSPPKGMIHDVELADTWSSRLRVRDEYLALAAGRPAKLKRAYEEIASRFDQREGSGAEAEEHAFPRTSELEGQAVVFCWDEKAEKYEVEPESKKLQAAALAGLEEDLDWRALLPKEKAAEGKSWELEAGALRGMIGLPGGMLRLRAEAEQDAFLTEELDAKLREALKGKAKATWTETREEDGVRCAVIAIEAQLDSEAQVPTKAGETGSYQGARAKFEVKGDLLWDLKGGHFQSARFERTVERTKTLFLVTTDGGVRREYVQETDFSGEGTLKAWIE